MTAPRRVTKNNRGLGGLACEHAVNLSNQLSMSCCMQYSIEFIEYHITILYSHVHVFSA